ncbi:MAG: nucleotide exchange factor GrpE [Chloroflexota bacterium]|nr:nucleotide exchange factor GrpE [Chloroflexota bacterium]MDE2895235.1 nucleotide exchange factor GrpE [Chloroflexota bacterium]
MSDESQSAEPVDEVLESADDGVGGAPPADDLESLREESARNYAGWQRAQADYENLKRRSAQDVRDRVQQSQRAILLDLLDLADDFERANREAPAEDAHADDPWRQGVELISQKLNALLLRQQVKRIETVDQSFNPEFHEAVGQLPGQRDEIVAVLRTGYTVGSRILRATQVMVGDGSIESTDTTDTADTADEAAAEASE